MVCMCGCTSSPRVNRRIKLIVEVWLIQVSEGLKLQLSVLEEVQLGKQGQANKPELECQHTQTHAVIVQ